MMANSDHPDHSFLDRLADWWMRCGQWSAHRPAQLLGYAIAAVLVAVGLTYSITTSHSAKEHINQIQSQFCNGKVEAKQNTVLCQRLFDKLLEHPTKQDIKRLNDLTK